MGEAPVAKKSLGQHWLTDPTSLQAMVDAARVQSTDTVLEIGPGLGSLTEVLVQVADKVVAVEFDAALAKDLPSRVASNDLSVVISDILSFDFTKMPAIYKVVANIPYYLTSNLIRVISETPNQPTMAVLLVQKEVAERVVAKPGAMSLLSVTAQFYWQTSLGIKVPAALFSPPPKVDSQILILERRSALLFPDLDPKSFFRLVKAGFSQRRKTLLNSLSAGLHLTKSETQALLNTAGIDARLRPQNLSLEAWQAIYTATVNNK